VWSTSCPGRFFPGKRTPGIHWIGSWLGPRAGLDDVEKRKFLTLPGLEILPLGRPASSQSLYRLCCPGIPKPTKYLNAMDLTSLKYLFVLSTQLCNRIFGKAVLIEDISWLLLNCYKSRRPMFTAILDRVITLVENTSMFLQVDSKLLSGCPWPTN
jgi:hypothetical protein